MRDTAIWSFETARFFIGLYVRPEDSDPADSFELAEDIEAVRSGNVEWFAACVRVYLKEGQHLLASDYLGACAYRTFREFHTEHIGPEAAAYLAECRTQSGPDIRVGHYFPDMVRTACRDARVALVQLHESTGGMRA